MVFIFSILRWANYLYWSRRDVVHWEDHHLLISVAEGAAPECQCTSECEVLLDVGKDPSCRASLIDMTTINLVSCQLWGSSSALCFSMDCVTGTKLCGRWKSYGELFLVRELELDVAFHTPLRCSLRVGMQLLNKQAEHHPLSLQRCTPASSGGWSCAMHMLFEWCTI